MTVKKLSHSVLSIVLAFCVLGMAMPIASAAELKPVVTASFAGYSELMADIGTIGKISGRPQIADMLDAMVMAMTQNKGIPGLDKKMPIGVVVLSDGTEDLMTKQFTSYAFFPISDLKQAVELAKNSPIGPNLKEDNGVYEIPVGPMATLFITQKGNWAYAATNKETFDLVANDPAALLGDMPKKYLLAVRATVKNIPDSVRQMALANFQILMQMGGTPPDMVQQNIQQIESLSKELDEIMLGITIDQQTNTSALDVEMTAKPGTNLAAHLASAKPGKSDFAGMKLPGAALTANGTAVMTDDDVAKLKISLDSIRASAQEELKNQGIEPEQLKLASGVLDDLYEVAVKTIESKKTDYGLTIILEPNAATFAAGSLVTDAAKIQDILKKLLTALEKEDPNLAKLVKLDAETYQGIRFNAFSMPTPDATLVPMFGDTIEVVVGIGDNKAFIAGGRDAAKTLKTVIDNAKSDAGKEIPASEVVLSGLKIAKFASAVYDDPQIKAVADKIAGALEQSGGKDHLSIVTQPITNGARFRVELEEGLLKALGSNLPVMPGM
jgi:hypothetical protein